MSTWIESVGNPNVSVADRLAIRGVVDAFALTWDSRDLDGFLGLFTGTAHLLVKRRDADDLTLDLGALRDTARQQFAELEAGQTQQRHLMASTTFLSQTQDACHIRQHAMISLTTNAGPPQIMTTALYDFWFTKQDEAWRISKYALATDSDLSR